MNKRIIELMKENGMNINDELLVSNVTIIYMTAQRDFIKEQLEDLAIKK